MDAGMPGRDKSRSTLPASPLNQGQEGSALKRLLAWPTLFCWAVCDISNAVVVCVASKTRSIKSMPVCSALPLACDLID
jgi:hypothetical protein